MTSHAQSATAPVVTPQLIPVFLGQIGGIPAYVCDARKLHAFLEVGKIFAAWIQERIEKYGFEENKDFVLVFQNRKIKKGRGGDRRSKDYHLTLDMAKELSMAENNAQGRTARRYFIEMEKKALAASGQVVPPSHLETLIPSEQQTLSEIVHKRAEGYGELQGKVLTEIWSRLHRKFRVARYSQLPRTQLSEAIIYVTGMEVKADGYCGHQTAEEYITSAQYHELKHWVYLISNNFHYKNSAQWAVWSTLRKVLFAEAAAKIPASRYDDAKRLLSDIQQAAEDFKFAVLEIETLFFRRRFSSDIQLDFSELEKRLSQAEEE